MNAPDPHRAAPTPAVRLSAKHTFAVGDRVAIFNSTLGGRPIFEGYAIVKKLLDADEHYRVKFAEGAYDRVVDPAAQNMQPGAWLAHLMTLRAQGAP